MGIDIQRFRNHINAPVKVKFGDDEFEFKPLNVKQFSTLMLISDKLDNKKADLTIEDTNSFIGLFVDILKTSYPELEQEIAEQFVVSNFIEFQEVISKLVPKTDQTKVDALKKIKSLQKPNEPSAA